MNAKQLLKFEERFGSVNGTRVAEFGSREEFREMGQREGYTAACEDEAKHTTEMLSEVVQIIEGTAPGELPITPDNAEAWTNWAVTVLKNVGVLRIWCEQNAPAAALKEYQEK